MYAVVIKNNNEKKNKYCFNINIKQKHIYNAVTSQK